MLLFALKMYVADMKRIFHRFWWLAPILLILIVIAPFHDAKMYAFSYLIMMTVSLMIPRYSRIHFVVPLDEKQIKKFFLCRIALVCGMMVFVAVVFLGLYEWQNWPWDPQGIHWLAAYLVLCLIGGEVGLQGIGLKNKFEVRHVYGILMGIISMFLAAGAVTDYVPLKWGLSLSYGIVILAIGYMFWYLKKVKIEDYTYVPLAIWENGKVERD